MKNEKQEPKWDESKPWMNSDPAVREEYALRVSNTLRAMGLDEDGCSSAFYSLLRCGSNAERELAKLGIRLEEIEKAPAWTGELSSFDLSQRKRIAVATVFGVLLWIGFVMAVVSCAPSSSSTPAVPSEPQVEPYVPTKTRTQLQLDLLGEPLDRRWPDAIDQVFDPYLGPALRIKVTVDDLDCFSYYVSPLGQTSPPTARLAIYHQGHTGDARVYGIETIQALRDAGWAVLVCSMPLRGENERLPVVPPATVGSDKHDDLQFRPFPLRYFVWPVVESLTMAESFHGWDEVRMVGISGGGWTTMLVGALDERITSSYVVAGTWPAWLNAIHPGGRDLEQRLTGPDLLDLYTFAPDPTVHVFNLEDPCCFSGEFVDNYAERYENVRTWVVENDEHSIAPEVLNELIR